MPPIMRIPYRLITLIILPLVFAGCTNLSARPDTTNKTALRIYKKLPRYADLAQQNWPPIYAAQLPLRKGMQDSAIPAIRERLVMLGDLKNNTPKGSTTFDSALKAGVKQFQWRHGLRPDGEVGENTLDSLNVSPKIRLAQLQKSMQKWAEFPENEGSRYILINTAGYKMKLIKDGKKIIDMKIVNGKPSRETPELFSKVETIVLNPKWNVPYSIMRRDIIPKVAEDPHYLAKERIRIFESWAKDSKEINPANINWAKAARAGLPYKMTQDPGDHNALGRVKFVFANSHDIYMHDTPHKELFDKVKRAFSSGCIRLEHPFRLVEYFIQENDNLEPDQVYANLESGNTKYLRLKNPMPIYVTYIRAWVDEKGLPHFREDVYKRGAGTRSS